MRKILPYILFYLIAVVVFIVMFFLSYMILNSICIIKNFTPTWINVYLSIMVGLFSMILFIVEER